MTRRATAGKPVDAVDGTERLLRLEDVAERLAISRSFAWKLVATGELRCLRLGRAVRIRPRELEAYLEAAASEEA